MILVYLISVILLSIWTYLKLLHGYWRRRGFPYLTPMFFFGNAQDLCLGKKSMLEYQCDIYNALKPTKLLGVYMFYKPALYIRDVNLIHNILHCDFRYFADRGLELDTENEPLTKHVFHLEGQQWKSMVTKVKPAFMPEGIKSLFFPMLLQSAAKLKIYLDDIIAEEMDLNLKNILSRYAADVIGLCAYGIDSGALTRGDTKFYQMSLQTGAPRIRTLIKLILPRLPNFICELFDIKMVETQLSEYFSGIVKRELKNRREQDYDHKNSPNDFVEYMMNVQKNNNPSGFQVTDDLIMAHCFMFFLAGYENATGNLCAAVFELADHPEIQEKLFQEIVNYYGTDSDTLDILTYEKLAEMKYLDMVVCETLRRYPPATAVIRECTQDYKIPGSEFTIEKGIQVVVPVCGIHRDPQFYPYADEFNPENFSEEEKAKRDKNAYLPFGDGPRMCLGKKFGFTQIKLALLMLVRNYVFYPSPKMSRPVKFEKKVFITSIEGGAWVRAKLRSKKEE